MTGFYCPACRSHIVLSDVDRVPWHLISRYRGCPTAGYYVAVDRDGRPNLATLRDVARQPRPALKPDDDTVRRR